MFVTQQLVTEHERIFTGDVLKRIQRIYPLVRAKTFCYPPPPLGRKGYIMLTWFTVYFSFIRARTRSYLTQLGENIHNYLNVILNIFLLLFSCCKLKIFYVIFYRNNLISVRNYGGRGERLIVKRKTKIDIQQNITK